MHILFTAILLANSANSLAQSTTDVAPLIRFDTCAKMEIETVKKLSDANAAVKYVAEPYGGISAAEIYRSSGDILLDEQILESIRSCKTKTRTDEPNAANLEQIVSISISKSGGILRDDLPAVINISKCLPAPDDYPAESRRDGEMGVTTLKFSVDASGKLASSDIEKSSGYRRLDRASLKVLSNCSFRAGRSIDGKGVGGIFSFEYVWKLN